MYIKYLNVIYAFDNKYNKQTVENIYHTFPSVTPWYMQCSIITFTLIWK